MQSVKPMIDHHRCAHCGALYPMESAHICGHDCIDYLQIQQHEWIEPHGEPCFQRWYKCSWCDETFTEREVDELIAKEDK